MGENKNTLYVIGALVLVYLLFIRKAAGVRSITGTIATGSGATPYTGYPAGYVPPGVPLNAVGSQPVGYTGGGTSGAQDFQAIAGGIGSMIGGLGSAFGSIYGAVGGGGGGGGSYDTGGGFDMSSEDF